MNTGPGWRTAGSGALTVLGALLFALGLVQLWASDTSFDADRFAGTAVPALEREPVRAEVARVLVDRTIGFRQDLVAVRPLPETAAGRVVASPLFRRLFIAKVTDLHGVSTDPSNAAVRAQVEATLDPEYIVAAQRITARREGVPRGAAPEILHCHGFYELGATLLDRTLGIIEDFLDNHPHGVVLLFVHDYVTPADMEASL
jgi:hypothetical protein